MLGRIYLTCPMSGQHGGTVGNIVNSQLLGSRLDSELWLLSVCSFGVPWSIDSLQWFVRRKYFLILQQLVLVSDQVFFFP